MVLTIDPARRLAQSLGIEALGNTPQQVQIEGLKGELYAMMLDMRRTFDELVIQHAGSDRAQSILDNKFYQTVATSMSGTQEYMAMEKLGQLLHEDKWDLIVVDTPPSVTRWTSWMPQSGWAASWMDVFGRCYWVPAADWAALSRARSAWP